MLGNVWSSILQISVLLKFSLLRIIKHKGYFDRIYLNFSVSRVSEVALKFIEKVYSEMLLRAYASLFINRDFECILFTSALFENLDFK